ncbi:MAG TPA: threonine/serine dehydratase [Caulobacteraceae bacterium]|jgi:threonine dehydratase|nr:threonine/serine dehydratase [Caulobacteraceae bacterium]
MAKARNQAITSAAPSLITLDQIRAAAARIAPYVSATPIAPLARAGPGLKAENLQPIGAFKLRGAFNALLSLSPGVLAKGVVAHSSGNHAQAVAYAAQVLGARAVIVMPSNAPTAKLAATRGWGAEVIVVGPASAERAARAEELAARDGLTLVPPFDALEIIAGTGTIALEILADRPDVACVAAPVSGGGLISGVAAGLKLSRPDIRVIGVEPELADDAARSLRAGRLTSISAQDASRTIADGLRVQQLGAVNWPHVQAFVDEIVTVSEDAIKAAVRRIAFGARLVAEPSGAVALAGLLQVADAPLDRSVAILSGGNVDLDAYARILAER